MRRSWCRCPDLSPHFMMFWLVVGQVSNAVPLAVALGDAAAGRRDVDGRADPQRVVAGEDPRVGGVPRVGADDRARRVAHAEIDVGRGVVGSVLDDRCAVRGVRVEPPHIGGDVDPRVVLILLAARTVEESIAKARDDAPTIRRDSEARRCILRLLRSERPVRRMRTTRARRRELRLRRACVCSCTPWAWECRLHGERASAIGHLQA